MVKELEQMALSIDHLLSASATYNEVCTVKIVLRSSSISDSSEKWRNQERKNSTMHQLITIVNETPPMA